MGMFIFDRPPTQSGLSEPGEEFDVSLDSLVARPTISGEEPQVPLLDDEDNDLDEADREELWDGGAGVLVLEDLLSHLDSLPAQRPITYRLITMCENPEVSSKKLAAVASADPSMSAKLMRLANSSYYGLSGRVSSVAFAITVLGFATVRSMAVAAAAEVDSYSAVPPEFWVRSSLSAVTSGELARKFHVAAPDAFCVGLLADIGQALLYHTDHDPYAALLAQSTSKADLTARERARYGASHLAVSSAALRSWNFPAPMAQVLKALDAGPGSVAELAADPDLLACLRVAREITCRIQDKGHRPTDVLTLSKGRVSEGDVKDLVRRVPALAANLVQAVTS